MPRQSSSGGFQIVDPPGVRCFAESGSDGEPDTIDALRLVAEVIVTTQTQPDTTALCHRLPHLFAILIRVRVSLIPARIDEIVLQMDLRSWVVINQTGLKTRPLAIRATRDIVISLDIGKTQNPRPLHIQIGLLIEHLMIQRKMIVISRQHHDGHAQSCEDLSMPAQILFASSQMIGAIHLLEGVIDKVSADDDQIRCRRDDAIQGPRIQLHHLATEPRGNG